MMAFRLQPVLDYRKSLEDLAKQAVAEALNRQIALEREQQQCHLELEQLQQTLKHLQSQGVLARDLQIYEEHQQHLKNRQKELAKSLRAAQKNTDAAREELAEAAKKRKALEMLKQKRRVEEELLQRRLDTRMLDEIAGQKHWRDSS